MSHINRFVYEECIRRDVRTPDIPVLEKSYFGQCGEDLIVIALLRALARRKNINLADHRYLEIGANHPIATSATYLIHNQLHMRGVLVEANSQLLPALQKVRPLDTIKHAAISTSDETFIDFYISNQNELSSLNRKFVEEWQDGAVGIARIDKVPACRINKLLADEFADKAPLFLSLDIEGMDLDILRDWDWARWRPAIIQVEPSDHFHPNNSISIIQYLESQQYLLIASTEVNLIALDVHDWVNSAEGISAAKPHTISQNHTAPYVTGTDTNQIL
ncbi:FkbM family methyltransferase [Pseudochrobactrum asaccharolyticum]|uniref:FkbM family methyltransferase n=1 Tax=Pseudochrobactrum asaccharolyticum TaxID=354351 RepID=A0A366DXK1_9HYPH|nr:FkbM family methyltransferase [Pseudochrobactrum asaccharolyticum]RBO94841.1 FkbM family methyltransferase [Pseudochrobactrum asaccharolyticum]